MLFTAHYKHPFIRILIQLFVILYNFLQSMSNWDDQFDFDDLDDKKKNNKNVPKAKNKSNDDDMDFFDNQDTKNKKKQPQTSLPTINSRNSAKIKPETQNNNSKSNPYASKNFGSKQINKNDDEYEFQELLDEQPVVSKKQLPKNTKNSQSQLISLNNKKGSTSLNKSNISEQYNDQYGEDQFQQPVQQSPKKNTSIKNIPNKQNKSKDPEKSTFQDKNAKNVKPTLVVKKQKQPENQYDDQFQNDEYGNADFEEEAKSPVKNTHSKSISKPSLELKPSEPEKNQTLKSNSDKNKFKQAQNRSKSVVPPKVPVDPKSNRVPVLSNKNINKIESHSINKKLVRSSSKKSIRSNDQKSIKGSRVTQKNESEYFPNKHSDMVERSFPHDQSKLNVLTQVQINKINEKMRAMIRKFNEELNDLINKNMILLKNKASSKHFNIDERIKELQIQKKSGQTAIQVMQKDFDKLHGREGELKEEEYQLILQKQIEQKKNQIKEAAKDITLLKRSVDNKGKKLSIKQEQQKNAQNIHHLKTFLIQLKKDQQKSDERIAKLQSSQQELQTKTADMEYKLDDLISQAKQKGISIQNTAHLQKRYEQIKAKLQNVKNFNKKSEGLISTKIDIVNHENEQIRIAVRNINSQINNLYGSIDHSLNESIKLIEKVKEKTGINPLFAESLDKLLKQIEQSKSSNEYIEARSEVKSRRSDSARHQKSKKHSEQTIQKSLPLRTNNSQNQIAQNNEQQVMIKPKFTKNKGHQEGKLNIQNRDVNNQRIWKEEEERKAKINNENNLRLLQNKKEENNLIIEQQKKDKSKPFSLKKNKDKTSNKNDTSNSNEYSFLSEKSDKNIPNLQQKTPLTIPKITEIKEEPKIEENTAPSLGPRMIKFGRKKNNEQIPSNNNIYLSQPVQNGLKLNVQPKKQEGLKLQIKAPQKEKQKTQAQQKPIFVPKRFNLRNKAEKKDDSYNPSVNSVEKVESPIQQQNKIEIKPKQAPKQEYKPKFDFKNQQFKIEEKPSPKKQEEKPSLVLDQPDVKPRFNLRLRDKKKTDEVVDGYAPSLNINTQPKNNITVPKNEGSQFKIGGFKNQVKPTEQKVLNPYAPKNQSIEKKQAVNNPYAPSNNNPYAPSNNNPYAPSNNQSNSNPINNNISSSNNPYAPTNNPYAPKVNNQKDSISIEPPKRERGPLKKQKISSQNVPKQKFNIYAQAQDLTQAVKTIGGGEKQPNINPVSEKKQISISRQPEKKKEELNLNDLLGLKKQTKKNDFDDLLGGNIGTVNTKNKKKNNDFFGDMDF